MLMGFYQTPPSLQNQFLTDKVLKSYLERNIPVEVLGPILPDLISFGEKVATNIKLLGEEAESQPPTHVPYDAWGKRIDLVNVSKAWEELHAISAREGIVAIGYERKQAEYSRLYQFAKLFLFHPSSAIYSCPLAMTDGAAKVLELHGTDEMKKRAYTHLTSRDPKNFWTSGQWMTEKEGGSDVSNTSTVAKLVDGKHQLYGVKWFTSASTSEMAMTLAKIEGDSSGKLSLFYVELRDGSGNLQNIQVNRLKDKLGTRALPTAELTLQGTPATIVGEIGKGVKTISTLFNITRIYNACCAIGYMRRGIALATDYAHKRSAFGKTLINHGAHLETLSQLQIRYEASFHLTFHAIKLLGREEFGKNSEVESSTLRLLIPLIKLFTAKEGVAIASEVIESFGGAGYIEDTHLPAILRNAQVLAIWEGTTNVLSLDAIRAIKKENAGPAFIEDMKQRIKSVDSSELEYQKIKTIDAVSQIEKKLQSIQEMDENQISTLAQSLAMDLSRTYAASVLLEHANWEINRGENHTLIVCKRWIDQLRITEPSNLKERFDSNLAIMG